MIRLRSAVVLSLLSLILFTGCGSNSEDNLSSNDPISLDWNIGQDEVIAYRTTMKQSENSTPDFTFDWSQSSSEMPELDKALESLSELTIPVPESTSIVSILRNNSNGSIDITMIVDQVTMAEPTSQEEADGAMEQELAENYRAMQGMVQLRGAVYRDGDIASFYLEEKQRNLIAMFFQLPAVPVRVGDSWEIDMNCIAMGAGFIAEHANRVNHVTLSAIRQTPDGQPLAIIDYVVLEQVSGTFQSLFSAEPSPAVSTCSYLGRGEFLINQGRWLQLAGELSITSSGVFSGTSVQDVGLVLLENVPEEYKNIK